jgi:hypothetical protein
MQMKDKQHLDVRKLIKTRERFGSGLAWSSSTRERLSPQWSLVASVLPPRTKPIVFTVIFMAAALDR